MADIVYLTTETAAPHDNNAVNITTGVDQQDICAIERTLAGHRNAYATLVTRYQSSLYGYLYIKIGNHHDTHDVAQEAFVIAYQKLTQFDHSQAFYPWLRGIAFNVWRNEYRKQSRVDSNTHEQLELLLNNALAHNEQYDNHDILVLLHECQQKLSDEQATLLKEFYSDEQPLKALCAKYQAKHSTITMRLHRIRDTLKKCVSQTAKGFSL